MEGVNMRVFVVVAISTWAIVLEPTFAASDLSFDATSATKATYSQLLSDFRNKVKDPKLKYGGTNVPVMAATFKTKYFLIDLKGDEGTITIALNKNNDLYVVGYLDKVNDNFRAHFFKDAPADAKTGLFPEARGAANRLVMNYDSSYGDIEKRAGLRSKVGLGVQPLNKYINKVYGQPLVVKTEAQFMLVVIQMFAEATRFKYIESMILEKFTTTSYTPDPKAERLEIRWSKISKGIKNSNKGVISPELDLKDVNDRDWKVTRVQDIVNDMALLKNMESKSLESILFTKLKLFMTKFYVIANQ